MDTKVYIYNQNCKLAGQTVPVDELDRYDDPADGGDWTGYDESDLPLLDERANGTTPNHAFWAKVARNLRIACGLPPKAEWTAHHSHGQRDETTYYVVWPDGEVAICPTGCEDPGGSTYLATADAAGYADDPTSECYDPADVGEVVTDAETLGMIAAHLDEWGNER
jgi:hypothetical protein